MSHAEWEAEWRAHRSNTGHLSRYQTLAGWFCISGDCKEKSSNIKEADRA